MIITSAFVEINPLATASLECKSGSMLSCADDTNGNFLSQFGYEQYNQGNSDNSLYNVRNAIPYRTDIRYHSDFLLQDSNSIGAGRNPYYRNELGNRRDKSFNMMGVNCYSQKMYTAFPITQSYETDARKYIDNTISTGSLSNRINFNTRRDDETISQVFTYDKYFLNENFKVYTPQSFGSGSFLVTSSYYTMKANGDSNLTCSIINDNNWGNLLKLYCSTSGSTNGYSIEVDTDSFGFSGSYGLNSFNDSGGTGISGSGFICNNFSFVSSSGTDETDQILKAPLYSSGFFEVEFSQSFDETQNTSDGFCFSVIFWGKRVSGGTSMLPMIVPLVKFGNGYIYKSKILNAISSSVYPGYSDSFYYVFEPLQIGGNYLTYNTDSYNKVYIYTNTATTGDSPLSWKLKVNEQYCGTFDLPWPYKTTANSPLHWRTSIAGVPMSVYGVAVGNDPFIRCQTPYTIYIKNITAVGLKTTVMKWTPIKISNYGIINSLTSYQIGSAVSYKDENGDDILIESYNINRNLNAVEIIGSAYNKMLDITLQRSIIKADLESGIWKNDKVK